MTNKKRQAFTKKRFILTGMAVVFLHGCQHIGLSPHAVTTITKAGKASSLPALPHFAFKGKASFIEQLKSGHPSGRNKLFYTAELNWVQHYESFEISLNGPVNQGRISITGNQHQASAQDNTGKLYGPLPPSQLLTELTGAHIPLDHLSHWITGRPNQTQTTQNWRSQTLEDGTIVTKSLEQSGWAVTFDQWRQWQGHWLPEKISLNKDNQRVKIFIYTWSNLPQ